MATLPLPGTSPFDVAAPAPGIGPQWWAGGSSAVQLADGTFTIAYRVRRGSGDDDEVILARSMDGVRLETVGVVDKRHFSAAMIERPALIALPNGGWRLYASFASPGGPHWWVGLVEASSFEGLAEVREQRPVFPGSDLVAVKDPVVRFADGQWEAWLCHHLLDTPGEEDRMVSVRATSADGITWSDAVTVLRGTPGRWDARGARVTALLPGGGIAYDGRASAAENWFERTGVASPISDGTFAGAPEAVSTARYLDVLPLREGGYRIWYEQVLPDESHELRTEYVPPD